MEILEEIKTTINEECEKLKSDIEELQYRLLHKQPTTKDLKSYSSKLEVTLDLLILFRKNC